MSPSPSGFYNPWDYYHGSPNVRRVLDAIKSGRFCPKEPGLFDWIYDALLTRGDEYFHLADFQPYVEAQDRVGEEFSQPASWARKAILNVARIGKFSSDRTISEYAKDIWGIEPMV